jgi:phage-related protein
MAGTPLAEAFVRVRALTDRFKGDVERGFAGLGDDFGKQFSREASARLRDEQGRFASAGRDLGEAAGNAAGEAFGRGMAERGAVQLGDDGNAFVKVGADVGDDTGEAAGEAFSSRFWRDANGRWRDERGRFVSEAEALGEAAGRGFSDGFDRSQGGGRGRGQRHGRDFGDGFADGLGGALSRVGDLGRRAFDLMLPSLGRLTTGFGSAASAAGGLLATVGKWTVLAGGVAAVGAAAASAAGYVVALSAALAPLGGLLAALPGVVLTGAAAFGVWKLAAGGLGEAMSAVMSGNPEAIAAAMSKLTDSGRAFIGEFEQLLPQFQEFKALAQDPFLEPLVGQMGRWLANARALGPAIGGLAGEFGRLVRTALDFATSSSSIASFNTILGNTQSLVGALRAALQPLLTGFVDLGTVGSSWLAGMSGGLQDVLTRFGEWMSRISASGEALAWMNGALRVLKQLGALIKDVWDIFDGLMDAAAEAGGDVLGVLGSLVDGFAKWVNSAKGQEVLVTVFRALNDIGAALLPVITALAGAIGVLAPIVGQLAELICPILTTAINELAPAIAALGPGAIAVFTALGAAVQTLAESGALTEIARAFAALMIAVAPLLPALADLLVPVLRALAVLVTSVVAPALSTLVGWIQQAVTWITTAPLDDNHPLARFAAFVRDTLVPAVQTAWGHLSTAFTQLGGWIEANRATFEAWGVAISELYTTAQGIWTTVSQLIGQVFTDISTWVSENQTTWTEWGDRIGSIATSVGDIVAGVWEFISIAWNTFGGPLLDLIGGLFGAILQVIDGIMQAIKGVIDVVMGVITGDWERAWNGVKDIFGGIWEAIKGVLNGALEIIKFQISNALAVVGETWDGAWAKLERVVQDVWNAITGWISRKVDEAGDIINRLSQVPGLVSDWFGQVRNAIVDRFNDAVNFVRGIPGMITGALGNLGSLLYGAGQSMMQGLIDGLYSMWQATYNAASEILNHIRNLFPFSPAKEGPFSGKGWTLYSGQSMVTGLAEGVLQKEGALTSAMGQVLRAGAGVLAPALPGFDVPSPASAFGGAFGAPASGVGGAVAAPRSVTVENLILQGVFDPTNPISYRAMVERLREAIRDLEKEDYADA